INKHPELFTKSSITIDSKSILDLFDSSVLANVSVATVHRDAKSEHSRVLADHCHNLRSLKIYGRQNLQHLQQILRNNSQLTSLAIDADSLSPDYPEYGALIQ